MKNKRLTIILIALFVLGLAQTADAHSLQWGVEMEETFAFNASGTRQDIGVVDRDFTLEITHLDHIDTEFEWLNTWPVVGILLKDMDTSQTLDMGNDICEVAYSSYTAVPIDDWSYLASVIEFTSATVVRTVTETPSNWGFTESVTTTDVLITKTVTYDKETGIMDYFYGYHYDNIADNLVSEITIERDMEYQPTTSTTTTTDTTTTTTNTTTSGIPSTTPTTTPVVVDGGIQGILTANIALSIAVAVESGVIVFLLLILWKELIR